MQYRPTVQIGHCESCGFAHASTATWCKVGQPADWTPRGHHRPTLRASIELLAELGYMGAVEELMTKLMRDPK